MVEKLLLDSTPKSKEDLDSSLDTYDREAEEVLRSSELIGDLDLDDQDQLNEAVERVCDQRESPAFWAWTVLALSTGVREALESNDASQATWLMSRLESSRSMLIYRLHLEALIWQGYSTPGLETLKTASEIWDSEHDNSSEEFWQTTLTQNPVLLYQAFNIPVILHQGKAYLGGKKIDNHGGKYADFILKNSVLGTMALVEIKTPKAKLLGSQYRSDVLGPSFELSGKHSRHAHRVTIRLDA
ncbi:DUF4263 domain-containing protein [Nonomuraea sp. K274]|uniref:DUF4263 domain-containing protein n=1 Tax=Nonomuraea cypriaca TaxID=1187855 RepID=A0A931AEF6_9ACTN|nr:Shedu anti-phage system protein SduA domain-containing protein [Nonomuraea cypriaca]MBF8191457.1 DUF4263 domain-containing protein [Nonomuraea cypriaca]